MSDQEQSYDLSELIRRYMGTFAEGEVVGKKDGKLQIDLGGGVKTDYLPILQMRAGNVKIETSHSIGEQVSVFFPCGDESQGRILGALFGGSNAANGANDDELLITGRRVAFKSNIDIEGDVSVLGNINVTGGDVIADGVSLKEHTHAETGNETEKPS